MKILKKAYKSFPKRKKSLKKEIKDIESKKIENTNIFPTSNTSPGDGDGR